MPFRADAIQVQNLAVERALQHAPTELLPRGNGLAVDGDDLIACAESRGLGGATRRRGSDDGAGLGQAVHEEPRVHDNRKQKIRHWTRRDNHRAPPDGLPIERTRKVCQRHRDLALVEHFYVAAQRHGGNNPFRAVAPPPLE